MFNVWSVALKLQIAATLDACAIVLWPVHLEAGKRGHWVLCVIYTTQRLVAVLDSMTLNVNALAQV
jgi:hypothetical protein